MKSEKEIKLEYLSYIERRIVDIFMPQLNEVINNMDMFFSKKSDTIEILKQKREFMKLGSKYVSGIEKYNQELINLWKELRKELK